MAAVVADVIRISDPDDPRIADYRAIRERDLVRRDGRFVAEGRVVLATLLGSSRFALRSLLVAEDRIESLGDLLERTPGAIPVFAARQEVMDRIAGFAIHRGILAIGERGTLPDPDALLAATPARATVLLLSAIANHDNMGGLFRNAAAFGVDAVLVDADCCDPLYRKAIRVSVGGVLRVPWARLPRACDPVDLLERHGFTAYALSPVGATDLRALAPARRSAILLGAEGPGLAPSLLKRASTVRIPMAGGFDSLNVATTAGIVLHHFARPD